MKKKLKIYNRCEDSKTAPKKIFLKIIEKRFGKTVLLCIFALSITKNMTQEQQIRQNTQLLNERMSNNMSAKELITYFKRAKIELCCDLIDDEAKDSFCDYYGYLPIRNINDDTWHLIKIG